METDAGSQSPQRFRHVMATPATTNAPGKIRQTQYAAPVNNHELIYHFQGFSDDGEYYIVAILPVTAPVLAETGDLDAAVPSGGVAYPDINDPNADFQRYYASVTDLLNGTSPDAFTPSISQLDALIQSLWVDP